MIVMKLSLLMRVILWLSGSPSDLKDTYALIFLKCIQLKMNKSGIILNEMKKYSYVVDHYKIEVESSNDAITIINKNVSLMDNFEVIKG